MERARFIFSCWTSWGCTWKRQIRVDSVVQRGFLALRVDHSSVSLAALSTNPKPKPRWGAVKRRCLFEQLRANRRPINPRLDTLLGCFKRPGCFPSSRICSWLRINDWASASDQTVHTHTHTHINPRLSLFCLVKENKPVAVLSYVTAVAPATALTKEWLSSDWSKRSYNVLSSLWYLNLIRTERGSIFIHSSGTHTVCVRNPRKETHLSSWLRRIHD